MEQQEKREFLINFSFIAIICTVVFFIGKFTLQYLSPFVLAAVIAYIMQRPAEFLSKRLKVKKEIIAALLATGVYFIFAGILLLLIYEIIIFLSQTLSRMPEYIGKFSNLFLSFQDKFRDSLSELPRNITEEILGVITETAENFALRLSGAVSSFAASIAKGAPSFFFSSVVALVASCYMAKDYDRLRKFVIGLLSRKVYENTVRVKGIFAKSVLKLIKGYLILSGITYLELTVGFLLLGINYALIAALIVAFVDLLPILGAGTVLIPWGIISLSLGNTALGFSILILYIVTIIVRNFAEPKIIGRQVGINPIFTLLAMFAGLKLLGFFGLILFPVLLMVVIEYYRQEMNRNI